jgi:hypothetical protein
MPCEHETDALASIHPKMKASALMIVFSERRCPSRTSRKGLRLTPGTLLPMLEHVA